MNYGIPGLRGFPTTEQLNKVAATMAGNETINNNSENKENKSMSLLTRANQELSPIANAIVIEGAEIKAKFDNIDVVVKSLTKYNKKGSHGAEKDYYYNIVFADPRTGELYRTFSTMKLRTTIDKMVELAKGEDALNKDIEAGWLKLRFGHEVFESVDNNGNRHTNVAMFFVED